MKALVRISFALALLLSACSGEFEFQDGYGGGGGGGGGGGAPDAGDVTIGSVEGQSFFNTNIRPLMSVTRPLQACAVCHQGTDTASGPIFLGLNADANYQSIIEAGLIGATPAESRLYTRGAHAGDPFPPNEALLVAEWIGIEASQ